MLITHKGYQFCCHIDHELRPYQRRLKTRYGQSFDKINDILTMTLDLKQYTLSYSLNGKDFGVAFDRIKEQNYRLAVSFLHNVGTELQLL